MNLLSLILVFLALAVVGSIAFIAWELTSEQFMARIGEGDDRSQSQKREPDETKAESESSGPGEQT